MTSSPSVMCRLSSLWDENPIVVVAASPLKLAPLM